MDLWREEKLEGEARYLYSLVKAGSGSRRDLGKIGLDDQAVYTIPCGEIAAVVHSCDLSTCEAPEKADLDKAKVEEWLLEHCYVVDQATKIFGTVLPFSFNVVVRGGDETVSSWLKKNYDLLKAELDKVEGKAEYSVQVFSDRKELASKIMQSRPDLMALKEKAEKQGKGRGYMLQRNLELKVKDLVNAEMQRLSGQICAEVISIADEVRVDDRKPAIPEKYRGMEPVVFLSCLVKAGKVEELGFALEKIDSLEGLSVRFTGPWAPFSFVDAAEVK